MKMRVSSRVARLSESDLLRAFLSIYEAKDLKEALQQWAIQIEDFGYNLEAEASA